jgi:hypothetical protein
VWAWRLCQSQYARLFDYLDVRRASFQGAVSANAGVPDVAAELVRFVTGPNAVSIIKSKGMEPWAVTGIPIARNVAFWHIAKALRMSGSVEVERSADIVRNFPGAKF